MASYNKTKKPVTYTKRNLSVAVRTAVWNTYIGREYGLGYCFVGCGEQISQANFECGHVQSRKFGGSNEIENLRPVCSRCNKSMGTQNMFEFMKMYGFISNASKLIYTNMYNISREPDVVPMEVDS